MMDGAPSIPVAVAALALERAINAALALDPFSKQKIAALAGQSIELRCTVPPWRLFIIPTPLGLELKTWDESKTSCMVSGAASDFVAVIAATDKPSALVNGGLSIQGDSTVLIELGRTLSVLDLDWESRLALLLGDIPAHQIGRLLRGSTRWGRGAGNSLLRHIEEFIHEEARLAPPRAEIEDFFADTRALAQDASRLEARLRRLSRRVAALGDKTVRGPSTRPG